MSHRNALSHSSQIKLYSYKYLNPTTSLKSMKRPFGFLHWTRILKFIILFSLLILFGIFVQDVFTKFSAKKTNFMQFDTNNASVDIPSFTFCFTPTMKRSLMEKYNLDKSIFFNFVEEKKPINYSIPKVFTETTYQLGEDFDLKFAKCGVKYEKNILHEGKNKINIPYSAWGKGGECKYVIVIVEKIYR